ncbi:MAG: hypothetical protein B7Z73_09225 [Planctomycetia bacterium 21-64-5]|nr:MAG: hypothetical protein B7Z73_09225 [Planctomycetia bacterium 21-64-5]HQU45560.1 carboxypeptidase-like regulatory domain-containing protein [Pirellulales bacterium]
MNRRFQFSLRTALLAVFIIALVARPTSIWVRNYLANRGLVPVKGIVTFKGQPLKDALVVMVPATGGKPVQGVTNASGDYEIETLVMPGAYKVSITQAGPGNRVPPKYASASMSGLTINVSASGQNHFPFDLSH